MKPEARLFIDCEFDGFGGRLISMALVEDHQSGVFYEAIQGAVTDPWVLDNVMPILRTEPLARGHFQTKLSGFLERFSVVHVVADHPADIMYLMMALQTDDHGTFMMPCEMTFEVDAKRSSRHSKIPHNALEDAWAIASWSAGYV